MFAACRAVGPAPWPAILRGPRKPTRGWACGPGIGVEIIPLARMILNRHSGARILGSPFPARISQMRPAWGKCFYLSGPMDQNHRDNFRMPRQPGATGKRGQSGWPSRGRQPVPSLSRSQRHRERRGALCPDSTVAMRHGGIEVDGIALL